MKKSLFALVLSSGVMLGAQEVWKSVSKDDWHVRKPSLSADGVFSHKSGQRLISSAFIPVKAGKKYVITGEFRVTGTTAAVPLYFGFVPYTADHKEIGFQHYRAMAKSPLATVESAKAGATEVILKKNPTWPAKKSSFLLALNAKEDKSDLPNFNILPVKEIRQESGRTVAVLSAPLKEEIPAGTVVRIHGYGASFLYAGSFGKKIDGNWQKFTGEIRFDAGAVRWAPGTKFARAAFLCSSRAGVVEFRNMSVTEVDAEAAAILPGESNIATKNAGAVITVSDSAEIDRHRAGAMYDGKNDTAWLSGAAQADHDIELNWFRSNVTAGGLFVDFTPIDYRYNEAVGYLGVLAGYQPKEFSGRSKLPEKIKIEVKRYNQWQTVGDFPVRKDHFFCRFPEVLTDIQRVRLSFHAPENGRVAIRELQLAGIPSADNEVLKQVPAFSHNGAYWIWVPKNNPIPNDKAVEGFFRTPFALTGEKAVEAVLSIAAYNQAEVFLNGKKILRTRVTIPESRPRIHRVNIPVTELAKENILACRAMKTDISSGLHGVIYELAIRYADGSVQKAVSHSTTTVASLTAKEGWQSLHNGFENWKAAHNRFFSRGYPADYWALDYSEPFFTDEVELKSCRLTPAIPKSGEKYTLELEFFIPEALKKDYSVSARFGELPLELHANFSLGSNITSPENSLFAGDKGVKKCVITGCWPEEVSASMPVRLAAANGKYQAFIRSKTGKMLPAPVNGQIELILGEAPVKLAADFPKAELRESQFFLDGKPAGLFFFGANKLTAGQAADQLDSGAIQMFRVGRMPFVADEENMAASHATYIRIFESFARYILQKNPKAKFMLVFSIDPLTEWLFANPDEQIELGDGSRLMGFYNNRGTGNLQVRASMASKKYRKLIYDNVYRLLSEIRKRPYANSVTAVAIAAGLAHENNWGVDRYDFTKGKRNRQSSITGDFGPAARLALTEFLQQRYGSDRAWAQAWKLGKEEKISDLLSFEKWSHERIQNIMLWRDRPADRFIFRDGRKDGRSAEDLNEFSSRQRAEVMLITAKAVKDASDRKLLVGGYAGYVFPQLINNPVGSSVYAGHAAAKILRESRDFDYFSSPQWCHSEDLPVFYSVLNDSLRLYGKTFIVEGDIRTHSAAFGALFSRKNMVSQLRKMSGLMLSKKFGCWFLGWSFSFSGPQGVRFFSDPAVLTELKSLRENSTLPPVNLDKGNRIALLVSEQSSWFMDVMSPANTVHARLLYRNLHKFLRTGAGCDIMALEDLPQLVKTGKLDDYRMVVFYNAFHLNGELRKVINEKVKSDGRTLLFFYAPGFHDDSFNRSGSSVSTAGIADLLGVKEVMMVKKDHIIGAKWKNGETVDCNIWWDKNQKETFSDRIGPVFYLPENSGAEKLAELRLDGKLFPDRIAAARIKGKNHTVIYVAVPDIPQAVLNEAVRASGTCIAADGNVIVNAGNGFLTVTNRGEARKITLRNVYPAKWMELPGKEIRAEKASELTLPFEYNETRVFRLIPAL